MVKNKPGIHLLKTTGGFSASYPNRKPEWYWHIVSRNGRIIARSSETYTRKASAVNSIKLACAIFLANANNYYDHSTKTVEIKRYWK